MAIDLASEITPQENNITPDAGKNVKQNECTATQATNGSAQGKGKSCEPSMNEAVLESFPIAARCRGASPCAKRDLPEPCANEEPESKRLKRSQTPLAGGISETSVEHLSDSAESPDIFNKEVWQGFCEIESEPAYFSAILRDMGVQGINVKEVLSLEPWFFEQLPAPIYGLILLYRYREQGGSASPTENSGRVWFANQLPGQDSCATLAMINIIMNSSDVNIGDHLRQFKDFTEEFTPYQRGEAFASFDFVKKIHNSFAKKMDMLEADKHLSYKVKKAQRLVKDKKSRRKSTESVATDDSAEGYEDNAHHFVAYIPVGNDVYMLDGMNAQPKSVGTFEVERGEDWLSTAAESILSFMAGEDHEFTSFAITQSPLLSLRRQACLTINTLRHIESCLDHSSTDWRSFIIEETSPPDPQMLGVEGQLSEHPVLDTVAAVISSENMPDLLERRTKAVKELDQLTANIVLEMQDEAAEIEKATQRRYDCGPVIKLWAEMLAGNGWFEDNLDRFMPASGRDKKSKK